MNVELQLIDEGVEEVDLNLEADLIGMTVITGTAIRAYELSEHFRKNGITVVLGGPHVTLVPDDAQPYADSIVVGYAEKTWPQLLRDFRSGKLKQRYNQQPDFNLEKLPFPRRDLLNPKHYLTTHVFEATRGCIHNCDFCVVPVAWGKTPYKKPVDEILEDIRQNWAKKIVFLDLNLIADKAYAANLFEALIPLNVKWYGLTTTLLANDMPLLELAKRSGCTGLLMGFESLSPDNVRHSEKRFNVPERYREIVKILHKYNISLMACFTFGMDHDTPEIFMQTAKFCVDAHIDLPRFAIVTPFPGTPLYKRLQDENRILTNNWELYDGQHVVFRPLKMTPQELYKGHEMAWKYAYSYRHIFKRISGSRIQIPVSILANFGYRFYAYNLKRFYNCDWKLGYNNR
jgi:radical SAM superfamily enzyme YgiQ (UPF0313 family)